MEHKENTIFLNGTDKQVSVADSIRTIEKTCKDCKPLAPMTCVSGCKTWKLKNQLRKLHEKTKNPNFMTDLLNTIKNKRRLRVLEIISKEHHSITQLQQELRKLGFNHSQQTIVTEYVSPLMKVGLADEHQDLFHATLFGRKISDSVKNFHDLEDVLSPHSECYEEITLDALMKGPRTYEGLNGIIPAKSAARVFSRLQRAALAETSADRDYIFFFKTKRNPNGEDVSPTEKRVYERISGDGISARKLAREVGISLRRTYKYLRKLKGRKLIFTRERPASYSITARGIEIGTMLEILHNLAAEALTATAHLFENEGDSGHVTFEIEPAEKRKKDERIVPLTTLQPIRQDGFLFEDSCGSDIK